MAVIQEAWVSGVSTRRVDDLVQAMGLSGISKSTVSKLCKDIDDRVGAFLDRPLGGEWPYLWLDATYLKQREGGRIVSVAAIIAVAANTEGKREIVGLHIGPIGGRDVLGDLPQEHGPPRPARREAGDLRRARGAEGGDPPGGRRLLAALPRAHDPNAIDRLARRLLRRGRRWAVQRDDMADLQAALVDDDALDDELQDRLLVGKARLVEAAADPVAEGGQVAQHRPALTCSPA